MSSSADDACGCLLAFVLWALVAIWGLAKIALALFIAGWILRICGCY